jgi:non-lysosomal glucosylceramidase
VNSVNNISYWGHYPIADLQYEFESPIKVSSRCWAPFIPGDSVRSNTPATVFEVRLSNKDTKAHQCVLAFSFPGPEDFEMPGQSYYSFKKTSGDVFSGITVQTLAKGWPNEKLNSDMPYEYTLGVIGNVEMDHGRALLDSSAWQSIPKKLPGIWPTSAGTSIAIKVEMEADSEKTVRFVLSWNAPFWPDTQYINMYHKKFKSSLEVAEYISNQHTKLLNSIIAWQQTIYSEKTLPLSLRESLVNILHIMTKAGNYVYTPDNDKGLFSIMESAGVIPIQETTCVAWWGDFPVTYFFPKLRLGTLRHFAKYQGKDGRIAFSIGDNNASLDSPNLNTQYVVNSFLYVQMLDRLLKRIGDKDLYKEFYPVVKKAVEFQMTLSCFNDGLVSIDPAQPAGQPWDGWHWKGNSPYIAGHWLCTLEIAEQMAKEAGDEVFANKCRKWIEQGSDALEKTLWNENANSYYLYRIPGTDKYSDTVFSYQLDGEFSSAFHGVPPVFPAERERAVFAKIRDLCVIPLKVGAANSMRPDGTPDYSAGADSAGIWPSANFVLAANYAYHGNQEIAKEITQRVLENLVLNQQLSWNFPQGFKDQEGVFIRAQDYYWGMGLWAVPPALSGQDIREFCSTGNLVDKILRSVKKE